MKFFICVFVLMGAMNSAFANSDLDYYRQFLYQEEVDDRDPENPIFSSRYLMSEPFLKITLPNGDGLSPLIYVVLRPDFSFTAVYDEKIYPKDMSGGFYPKGCKNIAGIWSVESGKLILPGVGYGTRALDKNGWNAVKLSIQEPLSVELMGVETVSSLNFSNIPGDQVRCFPF